MKSLKKPNFAYIFPTNLEHPGLAIKYQGQLAAFEKKYNVKAVYFKYNVSDSFVSKWFKYLYFEFCSVMAILFSEKVYIRYNPKALITNFCLPFFRFKMIYLEINAMFDFDLSNLNRYAEKLLHHFFMMYFKWFSAIKYVFVTKEIRQFFINKNIKCEDTLFIQNGYYPPCMDDSHCDQAIIEKVKDFSGCFDTVGIFVGGGYVWHGVSNIIDLAKQHPLVGFIIITFSGYDAVYDNVLSLSFQNVATLNKVYGYCNFGISIFGTDISGLTEFSSLKTREYLYNGLPVLTQAFDCVEYIDVLKPYVFNIRQNPDVFDLLLTINDKATISKLASQRLAWDFLLKDI